MVSGVKAKADKGMARDGKWSHHQGMANADQVRCGRSAQEAGRPRCGLLELWRECCGIDRSKDGFRPALRSPPILFPMPVLVHTHPLEVVTKKIELRLFNFFIPNYMCP